MLGALAYCHANGIVHRDLKLENFIFSDKTEDATIKLIDFGFSRGTEAGEQMTSMLGAHSGGGVGGLGCVSVGNDPWY